MRIQSTYNFIPKRMPLKTNPINFKGPFEDDDNLKNLSKSSPEYWQTFIQECWFKTYENPVTKKYDEKIKNFEADIKKRNGIFRAYPADYAIAMACIDEKTGELNPIAERFVDYFLPPTDSQKPLYPFAQEIKNYIVDRFLFCNSGNGFPLLIESLKDKQGNFSETNLTAAEKVLRQQMHRYGELEFEYTSDIINASKNDLGIVDDYYLDKAISMYLQGIDVMKKNLETLRKFPKSEQENIYKYCTNLFAQKKYNIHNFSPVADFCYNKQGKIIPKRKEFIEKIAKRETDTLFASKEFFETCYKRKDLQDIYFQTSLDSYHVITFDNVIKFSNAKGELPEHVKEKMEEFIKHTGKLNYFDVLYYTCKETGKGQAFEFNEELFQNTLTVIDANKECNTHEDSYNCLQIANNSLKSDSMTINRQIEIYNSLGAMIRYIEDKCPDRMFHNILRTRDKLQGDFYPTQKALPITPIAKQDAIQNIFKVNGAREPLTDFETTLINSIDLLDSYSTDGLPIKYSRKEFLQDLEELCKKNPNAKEIIKSKTKIDLIADNNNHFVGYNNMISLKDLNKEDELEKEIFDYCHKFLYENEIETEDENLNKQLNYIIKAFPEFINVIGKKQHSTHIYSLDIHSLLTLANSMATTSYKNYLNKDDKITLISVALLHDIGKKEAEVDKQHTKTSAQLSLGILSKIFPNKAFINRIFNLISAHHFLEELSDSQHSFQDSKKFAFLLRRPNDLRIAKTIAEGDLKSINEDFYDMYYYTIDGDHAKDVASHIADYHSTGNAIFTTPIIYPKRAEKKCKKIIDGREYTIINLHKIKADEDLGEYGFKEGLKKKDLRFLVHMTKNFGALDILSNSTKEDLLSETLISPTKKSTYGGEPFGVFLSHKNYDIITMSELNQASGTEKNIDKNIDLIFNSKARKNFINYLACSLNKYIGFGYFTDFYRNVLAKAGNLDKINSEEIYTIGDYKIRGKRIKNAITSAQNSILTKEHYEHNEIVGYKPEIKGVIAKVKKEEDIHREVLDFAYRNNYPIIMI